MSDPFETAVVAELQTLIGLARPSRESNRRIVDHLAALYQSLGWHLRKYPRSDNPEVLNLLAVAAGEPEVLFCVHTDTVPPGDLTRWTATGGRPRNARIGDGRVHGLGASDTLGSMAVLNALSREGSWPAPVAILFSADEEVGALGAMDVVRMQGVPESVRLVVVCEPTNNLVVLGEKGYVPFDVVARGVVHRDRPGRASDDDVNTLLIVGQEAHSARPQQGRNALFEAARTDDVAELEGRIVLDVACRGVRNKVPGLCAISHVARNALRIGGTHTEWDLPPILEFLRRLEGIAQEVGTVRDDRFQPPQVTLNVGAVEAVADEAVFACDLRPVPGFDHRPILDRVIETARSVFPDAAMRFPHPPLPPVWADLPDRALQAIGERRDPFGKSAYTEAAVFVPAGFATVIAGPGNLLVHRPNEYVEVSALVAGREVYRDLAALGPLVRPGPRRAGGE